ncbi:hypothetical+protein [Methylocapsa aurea]|uniref:hypothetical protein n=1 Tax=Methylocapsa aurea TaxID=663610 RepID=UPI003D18A65D
MATIYPFYAGDRALHAVAKYERRREATDIALKAYEATTNGDFLAAEEQFGKANGAAFAARDAAFKTAPTTKAGALALLRLVATAIEELGHDPDHQPTLTGAIVAAVDLLEKEELQ